MTLQAATEVCEILSTMGHRDWNKLQVPHECVL